MNSRARAIDVQLTAGVAVFRAAAWVWLAIVAAVSTSRMSGPVVGWLAVGAAGGVTAWLGWEALGSGRASPRGWAAREPSVGLAADMACAVALLVADGWAYSGSRPQSLAGAWPVAAVLAVAIVGGRAWAFGAAVALGAARFVGQVGLVGSPGAWPGGTWLSILSSTVLFALAGMAAAEVARRVREAEDAVADARARERVARDLHDGMLQTLAAIQRRSDDPALVALARTQESDLRSYLFAPDAPDAAASAREDAYPDAAPAVAADAGPRVVTTSERRSRAFSGDVEGVLRRAVADATRRWGIGVQVALAPPLPRLRPEVAEALEAAVGECLANVAKHAGVDRANLFAEARDEGLVVIVRDRGDGFEPDAAERRGLVHSVEQRLTEVGGTSALRSEPGRGTDVTLTVPLERGAGR